VINILFPTIARIAGLTMQASKVLAAFGIDIYHEASDGIISAKHVVHKQDGNRREMGLRKWDVRDPKRQNMFTLRDSRCDMNSRSRP
jgi:hypothetical protein